MPIVEVFKRGQIIPKRLGVQFVSVHKKARHNVTFGADVEVTNYGHILEIRALSDGACIEVVHPPKRKRNNGTLQPSLLTVSFIQFIGTNQARQPDSAMPTLLNPFNGKPVKPLDVQSDLRGLLITAPNAELCSTHNTG